MSKSNKFMICAKMKLMSVPWMFENVASWHKAVAWQFGGSDFFLEHQWHRLAQLVVEEPQSV